MGDGGQTQLSAAEEIRLLLKVTESGLASPAVTPQRLRLWLAEIEHLQRLAGVEATEGHV